MLNAYKEAEEINRQIGALILKHPINDEEAREWTLFARTLISTLRIIQDGAYRVLNLKVESKEGSF